MAPFPLIPGFYPDPSICRSEDGYFLVTSSFEYFPGVPLFNSEDLRQWRQIGHVLNRHSQLDLRGVWISGGIYAPTLRYHEGMFYMITTAVDCPKSGNFLVSTQDPFGPWSDPVWIPGAEGIDPDLFWDDDGTCYLQWSRRDPPERPIRIGQAALNPLTGELLESPRDLWEGTGGLGPEGPHLYKIRGTYYLCIAEGGTEYGHMQTLARSDSAEGPFHSCPHNPVLTHRSLNQSVHALGHADMIETPEGEWYGVALGIRPKGYPRFHVLGRETFLFPIEWDEDGWPIFGENGTLPEKPVKRGTQAVQSVRTEFEDHFDTSRYPFEWNWLRNPIDEHYERNGDGEMILQGHEDRIEQPRQATWIGLRQRQQDRSAAAPASIRF